MKKLCIIPAREGSKRIPKKNIRAFLGKPIIAYSIETALVSDLFDEVMVSTDSEEIAEVARKFGAKVPFMRSKKNADDFATTLDVIKEVVAAYEKKGEIFDIVCCLYATAPLVNAVELKNAFQQFNSKKLDILFPIVAYSFPVQRGLKQENDKVSFLYPENINKRSQDLETTYHDAGQFYWIQRSVLNKRDRMFSDNTGGYEMEEIKVQDIDNDTDWQLAEMKYRLLIKDE